MPYRTPGNPRTSVQAPNQVTTCGLNRYPNYTSKGINSARWKHNLDSIAVHTLNQDIPSDQYAWLRLAKFERTFTAAADEPDTPVANTDNFKSTKVWNGSRIERFNANIQLMNQDPVLAYVDVYMVALSFHDALVWSAVDTAHCPVTIVNTLGSINGGEVSEKAIAASLVDETAIKDSSFINHYIKKLGTLALPVSDDGAPSAQITITDNMVPPQCRRSNSGMYWGLFFSNPNSKNNGVTLSVLISGEISFDEIPSSSRQVNYPG